MPMPFNGSRALRTVVALTLVFLPLRPIYGAAPDPDCGSNHHAATAVRMHAEPLPHSHDAVSENSRHSHSAADQKTASLHSGDSQGAAASADNQSCTGPYCDGNCMSCTSGAVLALPLTIGKNSGPAWSQAPAPAYIEVILPLPSHPPRSSIL